MMKKVLVLVYLISVTWSCRPGGYWYEPHEPEQGKQKNHTGDTYFSPGSSWGGWDPPEGNENWRMWIEYYGKLRSTIRPASAEWDSERGPNSGWPQHWKGYGMGIEGVPPPPWAYVPESYDKPEYCFHRPVFGTCSQNLTRWGFNPTTLKCQMFPYSGCGGNDNNFINEARCIAACVESAAPDCETNPEVKFDEMVDYEITSFN